MDDFIEFELPGIEDLIIRGNWRSTDQIVKVLNAARTDGITQVGLREVPGHNVELLVGEYQEILRYLQNLLRDNEFPVVLVRDNECLARFRSFRDHHDVGTNPWPDFDSADHDRSTFFRALIEGFVNIRRGHTGLGMKVFIDAFHTRDGASKIIRGPAFITKEVKRAIAVTLLAYLNSHYGDLAERPFVDTYLELGTQLRALMADASFKGVRNGRFEQLANTNALRHFVDTVTVTDDSLNVRTMHKAKGSEFKEVLVWLADEHCLNHLFDAVNVRDGDREEQRITYVAVSRAMDKLYIAAPTLTTQLADNIRALNLGIEIKRIPAEGAIW